MIKSLTVSNFLSFRKPTTFSFEASKSSSMVDHTIPSTEVRGKDTTKFNVVFGPNGSGKSSLCDAFNFVNSCISDALPEDDLSSYCPFLLTNDEENTVGFFSICFDVKMFSLPFVYSFSVDYASAKFISEALFYGKRKVFENKYIKKGGTNRVTVFRRFKPKDDELLKKYCDDYGSSASDSLFLSFLLTGKDLSKNPDVEKFFSPIYEALTSWLVMSPNPVFKSYYFLQKDPVKSNAVKKELKHFNLGIDELSVDSIKEDEFVKQADMEKSEWQSTKRDIIKTLKPNEMVLFSASSGLSIKKNSNGQLEYLVTELLYSRISKKQKLQIESTGTRKLLNLLPLFVADGIDLIIIDEIDRSMHTLLTKEIIKELMNHFSKKDVQFLFTAHDINLLDPGMFRKDEMNLIEKSNDTFESSITKLSDLPNVRIDRDIKDPYLRGEYGAVPIFLKK